MAERLMFRPTPAGITVFALPFLLTLADNPPVIFLLAGYGIPALVILSLLLVLIRIPAVIRLARQNDFCPLPESAQSGRAFSVVTDPKRPVFLPGIRLSAVWRMHFGPFRFVASVSLPASGPGTAEINTPRRGEWIVRSFIRASDPFDFFRIETPCPVRHSLMVPPVLRDSEGSDIPGRPSAEASMRFWENSDDRPERRPYIPGDDPRHLDWKILARTGEMHIRAGSGGISMQGRVWIRVISSAPQRRGAKGRISRLDSALEAAYALAVRLENAGHEVRVRLPGESKWHSTDVRRFASALPADTDSANMPGSGERLWVIFHPRDLPGAVPAVSAARSLSCRVSPGIPKHAKTPHSWLFRLPLFRQRRQNQLDQAVRAAGLPDVRVI